VAQTQSGISPVHRSTVFQQTPWQQGIASLQGVVPSAGAQLWTPPHVPLVAPGGTLQTLPVQQSPSAVQLAPAPLQAHAHVPLSRSHEPEQQSEPEVQLPAFGMHATHLLCQHSRLQQSAPVVHAPVVATHWVVSRPQRQAPAPLLHWQLFGAQQVVVSDSPPQAVPAGWQLVVAVQWRTPVASGTQGAPLQHWSRNWQTLAVPTWSGSTAAMQQAGLFAS
jgi:hypothetical protein